MKKTPEDASKPEEDSKTVESKSEESSKIEYIVETIKSEEEGSSESASAAENVKPQIPAAPEKEEDTADVKEDANAIKKAEEDFQASDPDEDYVGYESEVSENESDLPASQIAESAALQERLKERRRIEDEMYEQELEIRRQRRLYIPTKPEALRQKLHDLKVIIPEDVRKDWIERLVLVTPKPVVVPNVNDDHGRESAIYKATLECVVRGIEKVKGLDRLQMRPSDFFADMVKSDRHMKRVKARVLSEKKAISIVNQRRQNRGGKARIKQGNKAMRQMQIGIEQQRVADAKANIRALKDWRQDSQRNESTLMKAIKGRPRTKRKPGPNIRRIRKDAKYGKGGIKRFRKTNTAASFNDPKAFNPYVHGNKRRAPKPPVWKKVGKGGRIIRPGKEARRLTRHKRRKTKV